MFYDGYPDKGRCAAGDGHAAAGYNFVLPHDVAATATTQAAWRYCGKCHGMFYDGYPDKGTCPSGGGHAAIGYNFVLPYIPATSNPVPPRLEPIQQTPWIDVVFSGSITNASFHVTGRGFLANRPATNQGVAIRVVDANAAIETRRAFTGSSSDGRIDGSIQGDLSGLTLNALGVATLTFSATDGRPNRADATGFLWSNTVRINFP
ncbi:hypothetical protein BXP70_24195 [Hymenobacter crusticola]|uniref:Uncharacterized protein n=2 Tax=Hymenobacter crusticola TaxID=1770526 RepID=A0A2C9ZU42_9BACT|nr:hypothetical protein BXP70_24195 [Hymenobacter crusticola]